MYGFWVKSASVRFGNLRVQDMKKAIIISLILIAALSCAFSSSDETH